MPLYQVILKAGDKLEFLTIEGQGVQINATDYMIGTSSGTSYFDRDHTVGVVEVSSIRKRTGTHSDPNPEGTLKRSSGTI